MRKLFYILLLILLVAPPATAADYPLLITHGSRDRPQVALTFDVCQVPSHRSGFDRGVFNSLRQNYTPATFFVGGDWLRTHPQEGAELAADPLFELGNHSWGHSDLRRLDAAAIRREVERSEDLLLQKFGRSSRLFRLPFGSYDEHVLKAVEATGLRIIQWDVVSGDPDPALTREQLLRNATADVCNGSIIILHANGRGRQTAAALPGIIRTLRARGFELVTVSTLLDPAWPEEINDSPFYKFLFKNRRSFAKVAP